MHLICGMIESKDPTGFLKPFAGLAESLHCVTIPGEKAAIPATDLVRMAEAAGLRAVTAPDALDAAREIVRAHPVPARLMICGSLYLAGRILAGHD